MPLLDRLFPSRNCLKNNQTETAPLPEDERKSVFWLGPDQVRILLFRECEWRGRKLLFDSMTLEKQLCRHRGSVYDLRNNVCKNGGPIQFTAAREFEREKTAEDDVSLLSEMVFGTVAMTYRGSSFKIHSMNSPPCVMCTKIFPATEHNVCKPSERVSDEGLGRSVNLDSSSSVRTILSRPSSGNFSGTDLHLRKSSTCSSTGSGWDIDIPPPMSSSQSLESNGSSGIGSLSSLRRRWLRVVSTSLGRSDSDDAFGLGQHWADSANDVREGHAKGTRHKTRLGLTMLVRLAEGHERRVETCLLEHTALLEGMLDRLRYSCIEAYNFNGQTSTKAMQLTERLYRSSTRFVVSLLKLLMTSNVNSRQRAPLLWHDVLLNSGSTVELRTVTLQESLQRMCQLFEEIDTKSTNFFLSTVVTAVLTYHLGWIYTALPRRSRQLMEKMGSWYPCNPLWAQLGDLYGALGNPVRVAQTVIAGDPRKAELINSVLSFLSYFIRSGTVRKREESRCTNEEDVKEAINILEQSLAKRPHLLGPTKSTGPSRSAHKSNLGDSEATCLRYSMDRPKSGSPLKRTTTMKSNLDSLMAKPTEVETKLLSKEVSRNNLAQDDDHAEQSAGYIFNNTEDKAKVTSKVKIIVSQESDEKVQSQDCTTQTPDTPVEKKIDNDKDAHLDNCNTKTQVNTSIEALKISTPDFSADQAIPKEAQVFFTLGGEEKSAKTLSRPRFGYNCQCSYTFTRVPSTSAQLPEGVLRKIIQRNFPESSESIQGPPGSSVSSKPVGFCQKCNGQGFAPSQNCDGAKLVLETPTNATEVLRTCGSSSEGTVGLSRSNSLENLMEANNVIELPMPRSNKIEKTDPPKETGFTRTLLQTKLYQEETASYTWGLVLQGLVKRKKRRKRDTTKEAKDTRDTETEWWHSMREECLAGVRFPTIDQPVAEALCILADLDNWRVGIVSNNTPSQVAPLPVGMSRLVANMLEAFAYVWRKYRSASHCIGILEAKLREMWLRSEALAEMLMVAELCDATVANLTAALDLDAADVPLLLSVATSHSPEIAQRFGLTLT